MANRMPFSLHTSRLDREGCPVDPTSPVPPPWDGPGASGAPGASPARGPSRFSEVAQMIAKWGRNPEFLPYEEIFRSEPNEAWFDPARDPDHPTQFEIASVRPERGQTILLFDYEVIPYSFSGITALDYQPLDDGLLSGVFGYSFRINGQEPGQLKYRLDPVSSTIRQQSQRFNQKLQKNLTELSADDYAISQSQNYAAAAGYGTGLHPQTRSHYGARGAPFTEFIHDEQVLAVVGVVYRPVEVPIAFIQVRLSGFKCGSTMAKQLEADLRNNLR